MKLSEMPKNANSKQTSASANENAKATGGRPKDLTQAYEELKNCSGDELMGRLAKEIQAQKESGTFDYRGLLDTIERIKIYLPNETYQNMLRIVESLK